jgi:hypothetical protein
LSQLQALDVGETSVTDSGVRDLQKELPKVQVKR